MLVAFLFLITLLTHPNWFSATCLILAKVLSSLIDLRCLSYILRRSLIFCPSTSVKFLVVSLVLSLFILSVIVLINCSAVSTLSDTAIEAKGSLIFALYSVVSLIAFSTCSLVYCPLATLSFALEVLIIIECFKSNIPFSCITPNSSFIVVMDCTLAWALAAVFSAAVSSETSSITV